MESIQDLLINYKAMFSLVIAIISLIIFIVIAKKFKLTKYQILIFALFTLFWMSIIVIRSYRKIYMISPVDVGGLGFDEIMAVSVVSIYGLISIFVRLPIFIISDYFKSRKFFILLSIFCIGITSLIAYLNPTYLTMLLSSLSIGIGASFISIFNVMFAETFTKENAIKSVSILSIAPLFGEFLSAPFQYLCTNDVVKNYKTLWLISSILAVIAFIFCLFFKDNKEKVKNYTFKRFKEVMLNKSFLIICLISIAVSFIKFGTSGTNYLAMVKLNPINMSPLGLAYLDVIFSFAQLIAGILAGTYLKKKIGVKDTLILGLTMALLFSLIVAISKNSLLLFLSYSLNGFGYGLTYNILIGLAMQPFNKNYREVSMSIYQTFFAIGIYFGDKIYALIFNLFKGDTLLNVYYKVFDAISIISIIVIVIILVFYKGEKRRLLEV